MSKVAPDTQGDLIAEKEQEEPLGIFGKYLTVWVLCCMGVGILIGVLAPDVPKFLDTLSVANISFPVAVLLWVMIFPMTLQIDFDSLKNVKSSPKAIGVTLFTNWVVQPFLMYGFALLFFRVFYASVFDTSTANDFIAGAVILGGSPCTAMVFVWSQLVKGDATYTLVQVSINDILILFLYAPTLFLLLNVTNVEIPYLTVVLSIVLFLVFPFLLGFLVQTYDKKHPETNTVEKLEKKFKPFTIIALLLVLVLIFVFQGQRIVDDPLQVVLIIPPLLLQTFVVFAFAFGLSYYLQIPFPLAAPAALISSSNFFELGVGVAISAYGLQSGATLVNVVGVLVEVPVMLALVEICKKLQHHFPIEMNAEETTTDPLTLTISPFHHI